VSQQLGLDEAPFPVLVQLASLVEHIQTARGRNHGPTALNAPGWLVDYLASQCLKNRHGLGERFFEALFGGGEAILLLDGLDEAPTETLRENIARLIRRAAQAYPQCRWVVTSRPAAYHDAVVLDDFDHVHIDRLDDAAIETFLRRWYSALFPESPRLATHHGDQVLEALRDRPEIRLLARNPVMLTALGVVHWNEQRLPEQRAELYEAIVRWLSLSRKQKPGRLAPETTVNLLQELALQMQADPDGRQTQVNRHWAAQRVGAEYANRAVGDPVVWAEAFLMQEEMDSGIVVRRGDDLRFWHLTLQEFLAARAIAARDDGEQDRLLRSMHRGQRELRIHQPEWREMVLLLAGVLHHHGHRRVERMFGTILDLLPQDAALAEQARCAALLGAAVQDLAPLKYKPTDARYQQLFDAVFGVFERECSARVPIRVAIEAAEALGQAGDPRLTGAQRERNWITIQAGEFLMGSQKDDPSKPNYDPGTYGDEGPVHTVWLDEFRIGRYPVTVAEFARFVVQGGYQDRRWWTAGGYSDQSSPDEWEEQLQHPNRPVVGVSWFEAAAYAAWAGCRLPTEAQWERAARGIEGRKYAWGNEEPADRRMNYAPGWPPNVGRPTPVGIYPLGATPEGICDLCGNVLEWCADWQGPYDDSMQRNPTGPSSGSFRVLRGGSWRHYPSDCRAAYRYHDVPVDRRGLIGLRLVGGGG
jgi:formylglycine-generating enzyme required for sulfatase activity